MIIGVVSTHSLYPLYLENKSERHPIQKVSNRLTGSDEPVRLIVLISIATEYTKHLTLVYIVTAAPKTIYNG